MPSTKLKRLEEIINWFSPFSSQQEIVAPLCNSAFATHHYNMEQGHTSICWKTNKVAEMTWLNYAGLATRQLAEVLHTVAGCREGGVA